MYLKSNLIIFITHPPFDNAHVFRAFMKHVSSGVEGDLQRTVHTTAPWVRISGQTKKGPWGKTASEGHGIRVVQPKVDRTNNKTPSLTVVGITKIIRTVGAQYLQLHQQQPQRP